jgi:signal transduction histidine kinase
MRLRGASLSRRLFFGAGVFISVALAFAALVIFFVLHRFVQGQIDQRLDTQILFLASMLQTKGDGTLTLTGTADGPPFDRVGRGWYWQITGPQNTLRSRSLGGATLNVPDLTRRPPPPPPPPPPFEADRDAAPPPGEPPRPADGPGPDNEPLHFRIKPVSQAGNEVTIVASAPRAAVLGPLREAMITVAISLVVLGVALVVAMLLQVRLGLRPLERLRRSVADVRAGRSEAVPERQPLEIQPLVSELNGLLLQNASNLERARRHVANLAHGLKTPLATLGVALSADGARAEELRPLIDVMERRIRHHLGRARAAALSGPVRAQTRLAPRISDLGLVLGKVNADKAIDFIADIPPALIVACEQQDFDEMIGNLLENAFRWARSKVEIRARLEQGRDLLVMIDDDGPGLQQADISQALQAGKRLDETAPGFGFGLSITRELTELYGGGLELMRSPSGGLRAVLHLPAAQ